MTAAPRDESRAPLPFDVTGPLPTGTVVLEASAGTGKTWTIAALVTRYVAEGHARLDQVLAVTFSRAATGELRARVRERLRDTLALLAEPTSEASQRDVVTRLLAACPPGELELRRRRLRAAVDGFDAATVATTHEFCHQVLRALGTAADLDPATVLVEDLSELLAEVVDDLYLEFALARGPLPFSPAEARAVAAAAVADAEAVLLPGEGERERDSTPDLRVRFAVKARDEHRRRARELKVVGFDDLLTRVRDTLADPVTGDVARQRLRDRFRVVLVDEFQDTDPVQWQVLRDAFVGHATLLVIGDPKQAIYAFRGADVRTYLAAVDAARAQHTLGTNHRSDPAVLDGFATLFRGAALGDPRITVRPVAAAHTLPSVGPPLAEPVRLRLLERAGLDCYRGLVRADSARAAVAADVARETAGLLAGGQTVTARDGDRPRPLTAGDVAVLVRTGRQALAVREALGDAGIACVLSGTSSVFATESAGDWLVLLEAVETPHRSGRVRRLGLTPLVGLTAAELDGEEGQRRVDELADRVRSWGALLAERGLAALHEAVMEQGGVPERLLGQRGGERRLTDLRHLAEALHSQALQAQLGLAGLVSWLRERIDAADSDPDQERSRRLETDAAVVQVLTVHSSKGLEFPVVLVPFGWAGPVWRRDRRPRGHDETGGRTLHVGGDGPGYDDACSAEDADEAGEELRLLYVAATRAVSRLVLWWVGSSSTERGPLHRLLAAPDPAAGVPDRARVPSDAEVLQRARALASAGRGLAVEAVPARPGDAPAPGHDATVPGGGEVDPSAAVPAPAAPELAVAELGRGLDLTWRRLSYSSLTRDEHAAAPTVWSEAEAPGKDDEPDEDDDTPGRAPAGTVSETPEAAGLRSVPSPMAELPGGTTFGTVVHAVLETADLAAAADPEAELRRVAVEQLGHGVSDPAPDALAAALMPAVSTPLGPLADGRAWRDVPAADRLAELDFELPLVGGDRPAADVTLGRLVPLLREHLPSGDCVAPYADALDSPGLAAQRLRGYLAGSIDAVLRVGTRQEPRYVVVDHKTNRLADSDTPLTAWHYRREALDEAMIRAHYPLQALLYSVALHRFLRWRQPGYDPDRHLGGVLYLFLRGMCGPGVDAGVWSWRPPSSLVVATSDLLAGREA